MKQIWVTGALLITMQAIGISKGERAKTIRDSRLMSGPTQLAPVPKGTELDVMEIDPKTKQWILTSILTQDKEVKGWIRREDLTTVPKVCAKGYSYRCENVWNEDCSQECDSPVCQPTVSWECTQETVYNPETNQFEPVQNCGLVTKEQCSPNCKTVCTDYQTEVCTCKPEK